jgi:Domain of unknown function (DUF4111)/Nucleotidyltransferase domain
MPSTGYQELDELLEEFAASAGSILGENLVGLYLQGSFALGDADEDSDVDWIAVVEDELTDDQVVDLQAMHRRLFGLDTPWAQHLEGSYIPRALLPGLDPERTELWFLDNGASELVRDNHCNTAVVRWVVRERGVALAGPDPKELVDPVSPEALRDEMPTAMREWAEWARTIPMSRRAVTLLVVSFCRILQTLETGTVTSKKGAGKWALRALDPEWADLIEAAMNDRPDAWRKVREPAPPDTAERTVAFMDYAFSRSRPPRP